MLKVEINNVRKALEPFKLIEKKTKHIGTI